MLLAFCCSLYREYITQWSQDMNFIVKWQEGYLMIDLSEQVR